MDKVTMYVTEVGEKENAKGDRHGVVKMKGKATRGTHKLELFMEPDEVQEFQLGEFYEISLKQVPKPE